ncbi:hypothetical protein [Nocardia sp. NBC_01388]|uniref:hypothetical protein n=1 Tax=Nocardia sp. NBC_01388 TaxID=2903596 RepID=UPI00324FCD6B
MHGRRVGGPDGLGEVGDVRSAGPFIVEDGFAQADPLLDLLHPLRRPPAVVAEELHGAKGASSSETVRIGTAHTGRIITAAALILLVVTGAFAFSDLVLMQYSAANATE